MRIGIPAEIRTGETRVAATPETVKKLATGGKHALVVQAGAGNGAGDSGRRVQGRRRDDRRRRGGASTRSPTSC